MKISCLRLRLSQTPALVDFVVLIIAVAVAAMARADGGATLSPAPGPSTAPSEPAQTQTVPTAGASLEDRSTLAQDVQTMLQRADAIRAEYQATKAALLKQLRGPGAESRAAIRAQLRDTRTAFLEQQRQNRAEFRSRVQELKGKLVAHTEILEQAKERGHARKGTD